LPNGQSNSFMNGLGTNITNTNLLAQPDLYLEFCSRADPRYVSIRNRHYVKNKGVHAQQVHFLVWFKNEIVGIISGSSAVYATPKRDQFFGINKQNREKVLRGIINNIVFRLEKQEKNLGTRVLSQWRKIAPVIWERIYGVSVFGFETLVIEDRQDIVEGGYGSEPDDQKAIFGDFNKSPGTMYKADNWIFAGSTEGNTKTHDGAGLNESYKRVKVVPKLVWCKWRDGFSSPVESEGKPTWQASKKWSTTLERRLKRSYPDITEEKWIVMSADLKTEAKRLSEIRQKLLGVKFFAIGKKVLNVSSI